MQPQARRDFFVSFSSSDRDWAVWIAWTLEEHDYTVFFQDWDFEPGSNFAVKMDEASKNSETTLLVLSEAFLQSPFSTAEWTAAFAADPLGKRRKLLPVRVSECKPEGLLGPIVYVDLLGLQERDAQEKLIAAASTGRKKPKDTVMFPGHALSAFPPSKLTVESDEPTLWVYVMLPYQMAEPDRLVMITAIESLGKVKVLRAEESRELDLADVAVFILGANPSGDKWISRLRSDLEIAFKKRIPHRLYLPNTPESGLLLEAIKPARAAEDWRDPSLYSANENLVELIHAEMSQIKRGLRMARDIDWYQTAEHRAVLLEMRHGNYERARELCSELLARRPFSPRGRYNLGCILSRIAGKTKKQGRTRLLDEAQESVANALKYGFIEFIRDAVLGPGGTRHAAAEYILHDPDLETLFAHRPDLRSYLTNDELIVLFPPTSPERPGSPRRRGGESLHCMEGSMPVHLFDGRLIPLARVSAGDKVRSWNEQNGKMEEGEVCNRQQHLVSELLIINDIFRVTPFHRVLTPDGWRRAADLVRGDQLVREDGSLTEVKSKSYLIGDFCVFDVGVAPLGNLSVRGIIVHNKF